MSHAVDSKQAAAILIDPLNAPEPSAETGPGASLSRVSQSSPLSSNNPFRDPVASKTDAKTHARAVSGASNRSAGRSEQFPDYRGEAFGDFDHAHRRSGSASRHSPPSETAKGHRRRTSSLNKRFPGDDSDEPLKILRRDSKKAYRSPHLSKRQLPGADTIDKLDPAIGGVPYHHEGPYDAALLSRNRDPKTAPIAALEITNQEALKATPKENIQNAIDKHRPLDGVAVIPPGQTDRFGRSYDYEEGADLMHEEGADGPGYKRWAGKDYSPDDLKGKGEPEFSLDKAMKDHKISDSGIEMTEGSAMLKDHRKEERGEVQFANGTDSGVRRTSSIREGLKRRIGSLKHKKSPSKDE